MKRAFPFATVLTLAAFSVPAGGLAQSVPSASVSTPMSAPASASITTPAPTLSKAEDTKLEAHIKTLHQELRITPSEEPLWNAFANVMRTNDADMHQAFEARAKVTTMTAEQNMESYANLAEIHADGMQKLSAAFDTLYDSFPSDQKKSADKIFQKQAAIHARKH